MTTSTTTTTDPLRDAWQEQEQRAAEAAGFTGPDAVRDYYQHLADEDAKRKAEALAKHQARLDELRSKEAAQNAARLAQANAAGFATYEEMVQAQREARRIADAVRLAGLPPRHLEPLKAGSGFALSDRQQAAFDRCAELIDAGAIVAMIGERGTGKTQVGAKLVVHHAKAGGNTPKYAKAIDFFRDLRATFSREADTREIEVINRYAGASFLILDDAHERTGSDWELVQLVDLIDRRYSSRRPTLLISNQTKQGTAEALGPSICSRLREDGDVVELTGQSYRETIRSKRGAK